MGNRQRKKAEQEVGKRRGFNASSSFFFFFDG